VLVMWWNRRVLGEMFLCLREEFGIDDGHGQLIGQDLKRAHVVFCEGVGMHALYIQDAHGSSLTLSGIAASERVSGNSGFA